jgi:hypothetical protein
MAALREPDGFLSPGEASTVSPVIAPDDSLCTVCGVNPRAGRGSNTKCVPCLKAAAALYHQHRAEAEATYAARLAASAKTCKACKRALPLGAYAPHPNAKDGHRNICRKCVAKGCRSRPAPTPEQRARHAARARQPEQRARNLAAVYRWRATHPEAVAAHEAVDRAIAAGELAPTKSCEAQGCKKRSRLESHHNSYAPNRRKAVIWLCRDHHRAAHNGPPVPLKKTAPVKFAKAPKAA